MVSSYYFLALLPPFGCVFTTLCIEHGGDPNLLSADGYTPVHQAVTLGREDTLKILLKNGGIYFNLLKYYKSVA